MASGDFYQLIDYQVVTGVQILNVYFYKLLRTYSPVGLTFSQDLINAFFTDVQPSILAIQSEGVEHPTMSAACLNDPYDFASEINGGDGDVTGNMLPPFTAFAFRLNRATRAVRNGQKRIAGVCEGQQNNGILDSGWATPVAAVQEKLGDLLITSSIPTWQPMIVRRVPTGNPTVVSEVLSGEYVGISTQNTRKYGRGI